jgi:hypothetical protein
MGIMKNSLSLVIILFAFAHCNSATQNVLSAKLADAIYFGGDIITMEGDSATYAEAVAIKEGKIIFVGSWADAKKIIAGTKNCRQCRPTYGQSPFHLRPDSADYER